MKVRTRMAPSPTGEFHIGGMRTLLYNFALAKKYEGQFVLRIEDTDRNRLVEGATERLMNVIRDYGFYIDEGPEDGGDFGPYVQSERLHIYKQYIDELISKGKAYFCFLTPEETKEYQSIFRKQNKRFRSPHRDISKMESQKMLDEGKPYVVRLKVPLGEEITFTDAVLGDITYKTEEVDDQILLKSDGFPTYHFAVVVDDHAMKISHVMRGNEWLPSTPKHVLLYEAFDWEPPIYVHLPNLKEKGGNQKMSKRHGGVMATAFLEEGYLPEALVNFLMFLGWNPGNDKEIFSLEEFVKEFDINKIGKSDMVAFDRDKLLWYNKEYLKNTPIDKLMEYYTPWLDKYYSDTDLKDHIMIDTDVDSKVVLIKERSKTLVELTEMLRFFYFAPEDIDFEVKQLRKMDEGQKSKVKSEIIEFFKSMNDDSSTWSHEEWESAMRKIGDDNEAKHGDVFMLLRMCVVGSTVSPPLFESLQILGKDEVLKRLKKA